MYICQKIRSMGRNKIEDKKQTVPVGIETSIINKLGGVDGAKNTLYKLAHKEALKTKGNDKETKKT
jgi:hypothetical protein